MITKHLKNIRKIRKIRVYVCLFSQVESTDMIYLEEGGSAQYINVTLTSAVRDSCHGNYCELEIIVSSNNSLLPR